MMRAAAIMRTNSSGIELGAAPASGVPSTCTSMLIGTLSGCDRQARERRDQADAVRARLAHADDAAAAHRDARVAHMRRASRADPDRCAW